MRSIRQERTKRQRDRIVNTVVTLVLPKWSGIVAVCCQTKNGIAKMERHCCRLLPKKNGKN
jgi:hypothetical protein